MAHRPPLVKVSVCTNVAAIFARVMRARRRNNRRPPSRPSRDGTRAGAGSRFAACRPCVTSVTQVAWGWRRRPPRRSSPCWANRRATPRSRRASHPDSPGSRAPRPEVKRYPLSSVNHKTLGVSLCFEAASSTPCTSRRRRGRLRGLRGRSATRDPPRANNRPTRKRKRAEVHGKNIVEALGSRPRRVTRAGWYGCSTTLGVKVDLAAADWEDPDVPARCVSLWSP